MRFLKLHKPPKSDPFEAYLTSDQVREYCWLAVQAHPSDAELAAFVWVVARYTLARRGEIKAADLADLDRERNMLMIWGEKKKTVRYVPLPRPLIDALIALSARRPARDGRRQPLLPTKRGGRIDKHLFEGMSKRLHAQAAWAKRHRICMHILRKTGTVDLELAGYGLLDLQAVLGHSRSPEVGATEAYILSASRRRARVAERYFGWPHAWPDRLPEWDMLAPLLGATTVPTTASRPGVHDRRPGLRPSVRTCHRPHRDRPPKRLPRHRVSRTDKRRREQR
jgi:integrase